MGFLTLIIVLIVSILLITVVPMVLGSLLNKLTNSSSQKFMSSYSEHGKDEKLDDEMIRNLVALKGQFRGKF